MTNKVIPIIVKGPTMSDQDGNLSKALLYCSADGKRCAHFGVNDWHYFYCSAQDAPNMHDDPKRFAYPWKGAGKQIRSNHPDGGCPYVDQTDTNFVRLYDN